ncbi:hypothetical protein ACE101_10885 [Methylobacterium sp. ID0610]
MSRSSFAERFRAVVGRSPLDYLGAWRMAIAADRRRRGGGRLRVGSRVRHPLPAPNGVSARPVPELGRVIRCPDDPFGHRIANRRGQPAQTKALRRLAIRLPGPVVRKANHSASGRASSGSMIGMPSRIG